MTALTLEEATVLRSTPSGPWEIADPLTAIISDSRKWEGWPDWDEREGHRALRIAQSAVENLYRNGYVIARATD